ncbi:hypothetical protein DRO42_00225 [Candidatus Bathyarchaeota archaeon]|nr:MAG: hypothetical protein DRO42_00225 [Candidatus Bathyarchaeota archaeon]
MTDADKRSEKFFQEYLGGASLAFGVVLLAFQILGAYYASAGIEEESIIRYADAFFIFFVGVHIAGGALGGYLVGRRRSEKFARAGLLTSIAAYVIEYAYYLVFERSFPGSLWAVLSLTSGGLFGSLVARAKQGPAARQPISVREGSLENT